MVRSPQSMKIIANFTASRPITAAMASAELVTRVTLSPRALSCTSMFSSTAAIAEPILFVNGRFDHVGLQSRRFLAAARHGRMVTIDRATHMVSATHPELFTAALLEGYLASRATPDPLRLPDVASDW